MEPSAPFSPCGSARTDELPMSGRPSSVWTYCWNRSMWKYAMTSRKLRLLALKTKWPVGLVGSTSFGFTKSSMCTQAPSRRRRPSAGAGSSRSSSTRTRWAFSVAAGAVEERVRSPLLTIGFGSKTDPLPRA